MDINSLASNSQLLKSTISTSSSNQKSRGAVYAEKGEPMYQKDMDKDEDGIITLEEFQNYCDENDISYAQRKQMLANRLQYQLNTEHAKVSSEIREIKSETDRIFAEKDDEQYNEEMDENGDGKITYKEYIKYCEELEKTKPQELSNAKIETEEDEVTIKNPAKAVFNYAQSEKGKPENKIEDNA